MSVDTQSLAGSLFAVSAAAPASDNQAGFEALTFTTATDGEIINWSGFSSTWNTRTDNSYSTDPAAQKKTKAQLGECNLTLQFDKSNTAFYGIIATAEASQTDVISCKFLHSNGTDARYFTAQVKESNEKGGGEDDVLTVEIIMLQQTKEVKVDA